MDGGSAEDAHKLQLAGNEMLASFLWAVGEDVVARTPKDGAGAESVADTDDTDVSWPLGSSAGGSNMGDMLGTQQAQMATHSPAFQQAMAAQAAAAQAAAAAEQQQWQHRQEQPPAQQQQQQQQQQPAQPKQPQPHQQRPGLQSAPSTSAPPIQPHPSIPSAAFNMPLLPQPQGLDALQQQQLINSTLMSQCAANAGMFGAAAGAHPPLLPLGLGPFSRLLPPMGMLPVPAAGGAGGGGGGGGLAEPSKNQHRLQRKAESARVARVRKKHYVATLELEVSELRSQVRALQQQLAQQHQQQHGAAPAEGAPPDGASQSQTNMDVKVQEMSDLLQRQSIDRLTSDVNNLVEQFVQTQRQRQQSINFHFDEILDLLDTGPQYKMAFWDALQARRGQAEDGNADGVKHEDGALGADVGMSEGNAAGAARGADGGQHADGDSSMDAGLDLLNQIVDELQLTPAQVEKLEACRQRCQEMQTSLMHCLTLVQQSREQVLHNISASQQVMDNMRGVLTPQQVARFLVWVEKHKRNMEVFNSISER